ncbi:MAG TPA: hypothetical protein V6D27_00965 [Vampirovibrionales bacterium]
MMTDEQIRDLQAEGETDGFNGYDPHRSYKHVSAYMAGYNAGVKAKKDRSPEPIVAKGSKDDCW